MTDFLQKMALASKERAESLPTSYSSELLDGPVFPLQFDCFDIIAEVKDLSPSEGELNLDGKDRKSRASEYTQGGAAAISVLTEPMQFSGDINHLKEIVHFVSDKGMPVMRKDFLVDMKQILETRVSGASGVLLITAILSDKELKQMLDCCYEHSLFVLLESFNIDDVKRSSKLLKMTRYSDRAVKGDLLFGINTRNLRNLEVDIKRLDILSSHLPEDAIWVAESGISNTSDVANLADLGYSMALVGTALMKSEDPSGFISEMLDVGREAIRQ